MNPVASFPHLSASEFHTACTALTKTFNSLQLAARIGKWTSLEFDSGDNLRITKKLLVPQTSRQVNGQGEDDEFANLEDDDDEALHRTGTSAPLIHYDILLSSSYRVPVLYFHVSDALHRYPPTMDTLYNHIVAPEFVDQTKNVGVLGGITTTDHPILDRPVFFIHPCRTAEVMEASVGARKPSPLEYLLVWMGAMGKSAGLNVPLELVAGKETERNLC